MKTLRPTTTIVAPAAGPLVTALMEEAHRAAATGRRELARQRYESALYLLRETDDAACASMILRRIGRTHLDDGDVAAGLDCLTAALAVAEANNLPGEIAHVINVMAISYWQRGELQEAERLYTEAGRMARVAKDERLVAMVEQNLGVIASMQGNTDTAIVHHTNSLTTFRALNLPEELARQLNNVGMMYFQLGRWDDANAAYTEALAITHRSGDTWTRLMVEVNRVNVLIARSEFATARVLAEEILREATAINETRLMAELYKYCGVIARETGRLADAEALFKTAGEHAAAREDLLLGAETAREQAELYLALGRNRETLQALSASHRLFTKLQAQRDLADVAGRLRSLEQRFHELVQQWAQNIESKDAYTLGHCERVADYACAIATSAGLDETQLFWFRVGALLHDVGKIVVPIDILNKAGALTPEERKIMERHPVAGVELLHDIDFPWDVIPMIRGHHERWDGHGYPDMLAGENIPLAARILCVADVFDALTSDRPYRKAFSADRALGLMTSDSGRQFDPRLLAMFVEIVAAHPEWCAPTTDEKVVGHIATGGVSVPKVG